MAKQNILHINDNTDVESEVFKQIIQDEEFHGLISKFKEDDQKIVLSTIQTMVSTIEKKLSKELSIF